jgi:hypothetical protein
MLCSTFLKVLISWTGHISAHAVKWPLLFVISRKGPKIAYYFMWAVYKTAECMKLTTGIFTWSSVRTNDMPGTALGLVLLSVGLRREAVELFTVIAVKTRRPLHRWSDDFDYFSFNSSFLFFPRHLRFEVMFVQCILFYIDFRKGNI